MSNPDLCPTFAIYGRGGVGLAIERCITANSTLAGLRNSQYSPILDGFFCGAYAVLDEDKRKNKGVLVNKLGETQ